jgi:hypothetical protein
MAISSENLTTGARGQPTKILALALMLLWATTTFGDDTVDVRVYNDSADDVVVSLYDMNATPPQPVLVRQTIYGFAWFPASLTPGRDGNGHVKWSAETTGTGFHRCGHRERRKLTNDAVVRVFTNSSCVKTTP